LRCAYPAISVIILRAWADDFTQKADKCRRLILYSDSLKSPIPNYELLTIRSWTTGIELQSAPFVTPYYYSRMNEGSKRLADNTAESAFYTQFLANKAFNCLLIIILISILLILSTIYFGAFESKPVFLVSIISILLSSDIIAIAKKYWDLRMSAKEAFKNCSNLIEQDSLSLENAMQTVEDYHLTLIQSPPIPLKLYLKYRNKVNELYQQSKVSNQRQEK
jgi:hypothetical protein